MDGKRILLLASFATLALLELQAGAPQPGAAPVAGQAATLDERAVDPALWGRLYPRQYADYRRTAEPSGTKYGGGGSAAQAPSKLDADPRLKTIFDGYAFALDYRSRRGHAHMLEDQRTSRRVTERPQTGACLHCHASTTVLYRQAGLRAGAAGSLQAPFQSPEGQAQLMTGFEAVGKLPYHEATQLAQHPVACIDCHDPKSMRLRVTKPGFLRGIDALARSSEPVPYLPAVEAWRKGDRSRPFDPNRDASNQELRSMVCGQCHVTYYCGPKATLFFPWAKGLAVEQMEATFDACKTQDGHRLYDWKHARTGAEVLKAKHPEFELWSRGAHAQNGVSCADCHMPSVPDGPVQISDHHVRSPLLDIAHACSACHSEPAAEIKARVEAIQDRTRTRMDQAEDALVQLIGALQRAKAAGTLEARLAPVLERQRQAQWRVDCINAENSMGFHAPQEAARVLDEAIALCRRGQSELREVQSQATATH